MAEKRFEVTLEKVERIRVVVDAADADDARVQAVESERRGNVDSIAEIDLRVVDSIVVRAHSAVGARSHESRQGDDRDIARDGAIVNMATEQFMRKLQETLRARIAAGDTCGPFYAAVVAADGTIVAEAANSVVPEGCSHNHAEMNAIRAAEAKPSSSRGFPFGISSAAALNAWGRGS